MRYSPRQKELIALAAQGLTDEETAKRLNLSVQTVRSYWRDLREKAGGLTRIEIVVQSVQPSLAEGRLLEPIRLKGDIDEEQACNTVIAIASALEIPLVLVWGKVGKIVFINEARKRLGYVVPIGTTAANYADWDYRNTKSEPLSNDQYPFTRILSGGERQVSERMYVPNNEGELVLFQTEAVAVLLNDQIVGCLGTIERIT